MAQKPVYFPGLNGIRAIAAIAVVISHTRIALRDFHLNGVADSETRGLLLAAYGVSIFFVLSGFLITYLLQAEKETAPIDVKKFYCRRILRIWPLYYLYLSAALGTILLYGMNLNVQSLSMYIFYAANVPFITGASLPFLAHYWSLGVEEQFYAFWPWANKKIKNLVGVMIVVIVLMVGAKLLLHFAHPNSIIETAIHVTRFHCMMIGALGAILYRQRNEFFLRMFDNKATQIICWIVMALLMSNKFHIASVIDNEIVSVVSLALIVGQIQVKNRIVNLEIPMFNFLGKISYGIYVIHPLAIFYLSKVFVQLNSPMISSRIFVFSTVLGVTIALAHISYKYVENYFLELKVRFMVVKSSNSREQSCENGIAGQLSPNASLAAGAPSVGINGESGGT